VAYNPYLYHDGLPASGAPLSARDVLHTIFSRLLGEIDVPSFLYMKIGRTMIDYIGVVGWMNLVRRPWRSSSSNERHMKTPSMDKVSDSIMQ